MDFSKGYSASFYCSFVDRKTWNEFDRFEITDGTISKEADGIRQTATIGVKGISNLSDQWIRIYMECNQNGDTTKVPLFTGIASSPTTQYTNGVSKYSVTCYSVLKAIDDIMLPIGWYIPAGADAINRIQTLLKPIGVEVILPEDIDVSSKIIDQTLIAEGDETNLTMVDAILNAINWMMQIDGDGKIYLSPIPYPSSDYPVSVLSPDKDVIENDFSMSDDWFDCPNVLRISYGGLTAIARDDDPDSMFSTVNRGREIWASDSSASLIQGESLSSYATRALRELQNRTVSYQYTRRYLPEINQGDYIKINYRQLNGDFYVESQSITLGPAAKTSETVYRYN